MFKVLSKNAPFEKRLLEVISLFLFLLMIYITLVDWGTTTPATAVVHIFMIIYSGATFLFTRIGINYRVFVTPLMIVLYSAITFYWVTVSGINGSTGVGLIVVITISFIFSSPKIRKGLFIFNLIYVCGLIGSHYYLQDSLQYGELIYPEILIEFLGVTIGQVVLMFMLKIQVDNERKTIKIKNEQLQHLNKSLKSTVQTQFNTLKELTNTQNKLVESEKLASVGSLTAGIAHELNNPLNFVGGVVKPLKRDIEELNEMVDAGRREEATILVDEVNVLLDSIESGTNRASQVIRKLLDLTPGRSSDDEFHSFDLSELMSDILRLVQKSNPETEFVVNIEPGLSMIGNEIEINQVILNLLRNSLQAIPEGRKGIIQIGCKKKESSILLSISDNGIGMDAEVSENAFSAFYTTKINGTGSGLGLFISHGIIKKHQGEITLTSTPDEGTEITIRFPG